MTWAAVIVGAGAVLGSVVQSQAAKKSANAQAGASDAAIAEQRHEFDTLLGLTAPQRAIGDQALNALGSIYGYQPAANYFAQVPSIPQSATAPPAPSGSKYNPLNPASQGVNSLVKQGTANSIAGLVDPVLGTVGHISSALGMGGVLGLGGGHSGSHWRNWDAFNQAFPGTTVNSEGNYVLPAQFGNAVVNQQQLDDLTGTWYGATYAPDGNQEGWQQKFSDVLTQIGVPKQQMQGNAGNGLTSEGVPNTAPFQTGASAASNPAQGAPAQSAPDYSAFFKSPDYNFRLNQGLQSVQNSAAAQGGLYSGNAFRSLNDYAQGTAANEFGNYFNRQAALAGIGQAATTQVGQGALTTGANIGNLLINQGNARASGITNQSNVLANLVNQLAQLGGYRTSGGLGG